MRRSVALFVDETITGYRYKENHPMRPIRTRMTHSLIKSLGLLSSAAKEGDTGIHLLKTPKLDPTALAKFHCEEYLAFLKLAARGCMTTADPTSKDQSGLSRACCSPLQSSGITEDWINRNGHVFLELTSDAPLFRELAEVMASICGGSVAAAQAVMSGKYQVGINWAGGMHHAFSDLSSGFCYANDVVLAIDKLLTKFSRVLYLDLDAHHGDAVETAFKGSPRVLTISAHQYGNGFFPGSGSIDENGSGEGDGFAVNLPLPARTGDEVYLHCVQTALRLLIPEFAPEAVVVQCGADTINGDVLGELRVGTQTHTRCVDEVLETGLPVVLLGGGGYNVVNTARCWAIHTATAVGRPLSTLPMHIPQEDSFYDHYLLRRHPTDTCRPLLHVYAQQTRSLLPQGEIEAATNITLATSQSLKKRTLTGQAWAVRGLAHILHYNVIRMKRYRSLLTRNMTLLIAASEDEATECSQPAIGRSKRKRE